MTINENNCSCDKYGLEINKSTLQFCIYVMKLIYIKIVIELM